MPRLPALHQGGSDVAAFAKRFGLSQHFVEGRLRLANLAEPIFEALVKGDVTLEIAKAYAGTDQHKVQLRVFEQMRYAYNPNADAIRRMVASGSMRGNVPIALLIGEDTYALDWRNRCYRHLRLKERKIADGDMIRLPEPMKFTDGSEHAEFRVTKRGAKIGISTPDGRGRFRISRLMERGSKSCPPSVRRAHSSRQRRKAREETMLPQSLDPRSAILCGRANAERLAIRMTANSGQSHAVVRTDSKLQSFCVLPAEQGVPGVIEVQVVVL